MSHGLKCCLSEFVGPYWSRGHEKRSNSLRLWSCDRKASLSKDLSFRMLFHKVQHFTLCNIKSSQEHDLLIHIWEHQIHQDRFSKKDGGANNWIELENGNEAAHSTKRHNNTALLLSVQGEVGLPAKL